jgi:hypothetical protein
MNAPFKPPVPAGTLEEARATELRALFDDLQQLAWAIGVHADTLQNYCALGDAGGVNYAVGGIRDCLKRAIALRAHIEPLGGGHASR